MIRFENPEFLWAFLLIPFLLMVYILKTKWKEKGIEKMGEPAMIKALIGSDSKFIQWRKFSFLLISCCFLIIGLTNPQIGSKYEESKGIGIDVILCLDVSNSMMTEDLKPNRLERAKNAINKLLEKLSQDRVGIVVFAGEAYLQLPLTEDYAAAKLFLSNVSYESVEKQGTNIPEAIKVAKESFPNSNQRSKAIIVISDGENHQENALPIAKLAKDSGILLFTIGIGSEEGGPVPEFDNNNQIGFKKDENGNPVTSRLNSNLLNEIAKTGGGKFIKATGQNFGLEEIVNQLKGLSKGEFKQKIFTQYVDRFYYFIWVSFFFLLIEFMMRDKFKWNKLFNLDKKKNSI